MQLTDWTVNYDGTGYFEFPNNPQTANFPLTMDRSLTDIPYAFHHIVISGGGIKAREFVLNGTFYGASKLTYYNGLAGKITANTIQKLWLNSDTFYYVIGTGIRQALVAEKTNFIDYVATLMTISPFAYTTARNTTKNVTAATETVTAALTNTGNADSVPKLTITNNSSANITQIDIGDGATFAASTHKITWTHSTGLASGQTLIIYPFNLVNTSGVGDIKSMRLGYPEKSSANYGSCKIVGGSLPRVTAGTTAQTFNIKLTGCNASTDVRLDWNDANTG
jgi:hypothetical protein